MCCVNGLPMQVGLNTLLRQGKPDRLLIEPTGLGHPKQILDLLTAPVYEPWIDLRATLCILDPRLLLDEKSASNENFRDQLAAAYGIRHHLIRPCDARKRASERWREGGSKRQSAAWHQRQGDDLHIETQNVAPPDSRIELISSSEADWNALQSALLKLRLATTA